MVRWIPLLAVLAVVAAVSRVEAAPTLTVTQITRDGQSVASAPDVALRPLNGHVLPQGVRRGMALPDDVRVEVPAHVSVTITAPGGSRARLEPGAIDTFHYTGSVESVAVNAGKTNVDGPLDFYHISGPGFDALAQGTVYSVEVNPKSITIICTSGRVKATKVGTAAVGSGASGQQPGAQANIERVDTIGSGRRRSLTYHRGQQSAADIASQVRADQTAAGHGDADAEFNLGARYAHGQGVPQDYLTALHWYQLAAAQGNASAENNLGFMYHVGHGVPQDYATALHWYQLAAAQGQAAAGNNLGFMYDLGQGVPQDYAMALHWYQLAAAQGDDAAEYNIGRMNDLGHGVPQDYAIALHWYQLAAAQGNASGENNIGAMYYYGHGVPQDYATALHWYQLAAVQGNASGETNLGFMYGDGHGVPQDYAMALHWYQLAAAQDQPRALYHLGYMYEHGYGVPQGYTQALDYYQRAAAAGEDRDSALALAHMYATGEGVSIDRDTAFGWILIASALGNGAQVRVAYQAALKTYSSAEQVAGRAFAQRYIDDYARRTGTRLSLPVPQ